MNRTGPEIGVAAGKFWAATGVYAHSDKELKNNIKQLSKERISNIDKVNPSSFEWKDTGKKDIGFIAQDVEKVYPEFVKKGPDGKLGVDYAKFTPILTGAVQEIKKSVPDNQHLCIEDVCVTKNDLLKLKRQ